ncbi:MAG: hypothetical protein QGF99_04585 [Acidimicrobiales bacterium]|jgi:hypothetical protein|nr:hypothetical protein [Acidimicrobiales bacterium]MDP6901245.1 hypothetical protein [Acidimicrobiales bacterium]
MTNRSSESDSRITSDDLQERFSRLTGESDENPAPMQRPGIVAGAVLISGMLVIAFLLGRRLGNKRSTFVEIVRV